MSVHQHHLTRFAALVAVVLALPIQASGQDFTRLTASHGPPGGYTEAPAGKTALRLAWLCAGESPELWIAVNVPVGVDGTKPVRAFWRVADGLPEAEAIWEEDPEYFRSGLMLPTEGNWWGMAFEDRDEVPFTKDALTARSIELWFFGYDSDERDGPYVFGVRGLRDVLDDLGCAPRIEER